MKQYEKERGRKIMKKNEKEMKRKYGKNETERKNYEMEM